MGDDPIETAAHRGLGRLHAAVITGVEARLITVEVHRGNGLPDTTIVGMPGTAVRESFDRIRTACAESGLRLRSRKTIVNLAPASERKSGAGLDLPIALATLAADGRVESDELEPPWVCLGELALDGAVRAVPGVLPMALAAHREGLSRLLLPRENLGEVASIPGLRVVGVRSLGEALEALRTPPDTRDAEPPPPAATQRPRLDVREIIGQPFAKRALEIAAAGGHHLLMIGPPGAGKTLLARALPGILPPLDFDEAVEVSAVYSVIGLLAGRGLMRDRPFRDPHHSITPAGLVGGRLPPRPGEISLAHHGVLFLDELPEFRRAVLESLRQPLEEGSIVLTRGGESVRLPARFQLVAAMNPCPCGRGLHDPDCRCGEGETMRYWRKVSGPFLDRIDLFVRVDRPDTDEVIGGSRAGDPSERVAERVAAARRRQLERHAELDWPEGVATNAQLPGDALSRVCRLTAELESAARERAERFRLSHRGWHRVLRVARTAADLSGAEEIGADHLDEALAYRRPLDPFEDAP